MSIGLEDNIPTLLVILLVIAFLVSLSQSMLLKGVGSDNPVHVFVINVIREKNRRLFSIMPRILNESYLGAMPMFLHLGLSFFNIKYLKLIAVLLNPLVNLMTSLLFVSWLYASSQDVDSAGLLVMLAFFVLTPQFYHALSARNYGISSRTVGIFLFTLFYVVAFELESNDAPIHYYSILVFVSYLIFGFNTFASQALVFVSVIALVIYGYWYWLLATLLGAGVLIIVHPNYGASYLIHTCKFMNTYRVQLASVFILKHRSSIWKDLVGDGWKKYKSEGATKAISYAYGNSLLIAFLLNPLTLLGAIGGLWLPQTDPLVGFCVMMSQIGVALFFLTTFRLSRFLGEPERYIELVTVFGVIAGVSIMSMIIEQSGIAMMLAYYFLAVLMQIAITKKLGQIVGSNVSQLHDIYKHINQLRKGDEVRFTANSDEIIKQASDQSWSFARYWSFEEKLAGQNVVEVYERFPIMYPEAFLRIVNEYKINVFVIDKSAWNDKFYKSDLWPTDSKKIMETEKYLLYTR
jgi:hypothetical protein